jgi:hypothetical protein
VFSALKKTQDLLLQKTGGFQETACFLLIMQIPSPEQREKMIIFWGKELTSSPRLFPPIAAPPRIRPLLQATTSLTD